MASLNNHTAFSSFIPDIGAVAEDGNKGKGNNTGDDGNGYDDDGSWR
jgi:hypothetical protein